MADGIYTYPLVLPYALEAARAILLLCILALALIAAWK